MSKLRKTLRATAEKRLDDAVDTIIEHARQHADALGVDNSKLLTLAAGGRVDTLNSRLITEVTNTLEDEVIAQYNDQADLPLEQSDE